MTDAWTVASLLASLVAAAAAVAAYSRSTRHDPGEASRLLREELRAAREESARIAADQRDDAARTAREAREEQARLGAALRDEQAKSAAALRDEVSRSVSAVREAVDARLRELQASNEARLDQMRRTVDEKLHETLEKRLGESFRTVSTHLEAVHRGLGEMQALASGVGDLKKVLTNVKTRGTWGEVQLGAILEQVLVPEQFGRNVATREGSREVVEFAVRLPGAGDGDVVWLPIDSKFPHEDYARLVDASEAGDAGAVQDASAGLARAVRRSAQDIRDKYLDPPRTTDFAILFLPTEGLYAEVLRQAGLVEELQRSFRVVVTGPTTLAATLSSLRMGFRTLAIEKRASEVWQVLGAVKTEFGKFAGVLDKVQKQLATASRTLEETGTRTRAMERRLRVVETLPEDEAAMVLEAAKEVGLGMAASADDEDEGEGGA